MVSEQGVTGKACSSHIRNRAVELLLMKESGCVRVACRNAEVFSQDRGRCGTDGELRGCCLPGDMVSDDKGCSSLAKLNGGWLDLFRFARKGCVKCWVTRFIQLC